MRRLLSKNNFKILIIVGILLIMTNVFTYFILTNSLNYTYQLELERLANEKLSFQNKLNDSTNMLSQQEDRYSNFLSKYSIFINDLNKVDSLLAFAVINEDESWSADSYAQSKVYLDGGWEQAADAKSILDKLSQNLLDLESISPNSFFSGDLILRKQQIENLVEYQGSISKMLGYTYSVINAEQPSDSDAAVNKYNDYLETHNEILFKLNDIQNKIDTYWQQDWYENLGPYNNSE